MIIGTKRKSHLLYFATTTLKLSSRFKKTYNNTHTDISLAKTRAKDTQPALRITRIANRGLHSHFKFVLSLGFELELKRVELERRTPVGTQISQRIFVRLIAGIRNTRPRELKIVSMLCWWRKGKV